MVSNLCVCGFTNRFGGKKHLVWLEPEGLNSSVIYPGGLSCTMPVEIQERMIHAIPGLENAVILRSGLSRSKRFVSFSQPFYYINWKII